MMHYRLVFNGKLYEAQTNAFRYRVAEIIEQQDMESLTVIFSSEGGNTDQGLALYNFIRALPIPIRMHAAGHVGSMAVPVFLSSAVRTCTPFSRFSFHAYDWTFEGRQIADRIVEALQRLESDIALSKQIVARHTSLSVEMLDRLYSRAPTPAILAPEEARTRGIVQEIVELNPLGEKQENIALWTVGWG